jgi:hypothetical protein
MLGSPGWAPELVQRDHLEVDGEVLWPGHKTRSICREPCRHFTRMISAEGQVAFCTRTSSLEQLGTFFFFRRWPWYSLGRGAMYSRGWSGAISSGRWWRSAPLSSNAT